MGSDVQAEQGVHGAKEGRPGPAGQPDELIRSGDCSATAGDEQVAVGQLSDSQDNPQRHIHHHRRRPTRRCRHRHHLHIR